VSKLAYQNIKQNKNRSLLVSIGMAIGIAAVLLILCLSSGLTGYINNVYKESLQSLQLSVTKSSGTTFSTTEITNISSLTGLNDLTESYYYSSATYTYNDAEGLINKVQIYYDDYQPEMLYGSILDDDDTYSYIVINEALATILGNGSIVASVGQTITLTGAVSKTFKISGVYTDDTTSSTLINIYLSGASMKSLLNVTTLSANMLYVSASDVTYVSALKSDLTAMAFTIYQADSSADTVLEYVDLGTTVLTAVSAISMIVSAIMIFIVLYISVTERMKEIGILRAVGARKKDISKMFLFEAGMMGLMGGLMGVAICFILSVITNIVCLSTLSYSLISYNVGYYLLGILTSIIISVLAGIAPSMRAADLDPVEALRSE